MSAQYSKEGYQRQRGLPDYCLYNSVTHSTSQTNKASSKATKLSLWSITRNINQFSDKSNETNIAMTSCSGAMNINSPDCISFRIMRDTTLFVFLFLFSYFTFTFSFFLIHLLLFPTLFLFPLLFSLTLTFSCSLVLSLSRDLSVACSLALSIYCSVRSKGMKGVFVSSVSHFGGLFLCLSLCHTHTHKRTHT